MRKLIHVTSRATRKIVSQPREAWLLCGMAFWVVVVSVAARCYSLPRALQLVAGNKNRRQGLPVEASKDDLARAIDLVLSADVFMFKPVCWKRAAVLHRYLARNGIATQIIFGVRNETGGRVSGHAWLEANGTPLLEQSPPEYVVTYRF